MKAAPKIPHIPENERTPAVVVLLEFIQVLLELFQEFKDEIARLKGQKPKPKIKPSLLEKDPPDREKRNGGEKRPGSAKRKKTKELKIHDTEIIPAPNVPQGSVRKGFEEFIVQGLRFESYNRLVKRERWLTPEGKHIVAPLPEHLKGLGSHFSPELQCYILCQHYHCQVTQPLIHEQLVDVGVDISRGQVNRILTEGKERFHAEKDEILRVGLRISSYINTDDTGARHQGKNGYCTHIGNEWFTWFASTPRKSRINFLELLRAGATDYVLNRDAFAYLEIQKFPKTQLKRLEALHERVSQDEKEWKAALESVGLTNERHVRTVTEAALLGSIIENGTTNPDLAIISDDAGQFDVLLHGLCWIHAERPIRKLVGFTDIQREALERTRSQIWEFYRELKAYKNAPSPEKKAELENRFDEIFTTRTSYETLNQELAKIFKKKSELLLVLDRPEVPLHNNQSERDIREYAKKRKVSGSTRSDEGRRCRDTFASHKKTTRKLGVSFWDYLMARVSGSNSVPWLPDLLKQRMTVSRE
jgi:Transposase IS66 family